MVRDTINKHADKTWIGGIRRKFVNAGTGGRAAMVAGAGAAALGTIGLGSAAGYHLGKNRDS